MPRSTADALTGRQDEDKTTTHCSLHRERIYLYNVYRPRLSRIYGRSRFLYLYFWQSWLSEPCQPPLAARIVCYVDTYRKARAHVTNDTSLRALRYEPPNEVTADAMTTIMTPSHPPTLPSGPCDAAATTAVIGRAVGTVGKIIEKKLGKCLEVITQVAIFAISN